MKTRRYRQKQRAASQRETRERIVDAAVALHEELGPAATTISALAERAGVQRLTVYRHFANEKEILNACSAKWFASHQPPDVAGIKGADARGRTRAVFRALYDYYSQTQGMWRSLYADLGRLAALDEIMAGFDGYLAAVADSVLRDWTPARSMKLRATVAHALHFSTWQSLEAQGLGRAAMAELVAAWVEAAAEPNRRQ